MDFTYEDGSTVSYDDAGHIVQIVDAEGALQPAPGAFGSAIVRQFSDLFNYGARAFIDSEVRDSPSPSLTARNAPGTAAANAQGAWRQYVPLILLALGGVLAWRALRA